MPAANRTASRARGKAAKGGRKRVTRGRVEIPETGLPFGASERLSKQRLRSRKRKTGGGA